MNVTWIKYEFEVLKKEGKWNKVGGLYIFAGLLTDPQGIDQWFPYYIGQTGDFSDRIPNHEKWEEAVQLGATHVHARVVKTPLARGLIERELISSFQPPLNLDS